MSASAEGSSRCVDRLSRFLAAAKPGGLGTRGDNLSASACLVMARMLLDPAFGEFVITGTHPETGWSTPGSPSERFAAQAIDVHRRVVGTRRATRRIPPDARHGPADVSPRAAAAQLSITAARHVLPTRYLWYPVLWRRNAMLDRLESALQQDRLAMVYLGSGVRPRRAVLVVAADATTWSCFEPGSTAVRTLERQDLDLPSGSPGQRTLLVVMPTGRRARG